MWKGISSHFSLKPRLLLCICGHLHHGTHMEVREQLGSPAVDSEAYYWLLVN